MEGRECESTEETWESVLSRWIPLNKFYTWWIRRPQIPRHSLVLLPFLNYILTSVTKQSSSLFNLNVLLFISNRKRLIHYPRLESVAVSHVFTADETTKPIIGSRCHLWVVFIITSEKSREFKKKTKQNKSKHGKIFAFSVSDD